MQETRYKIKLMGCTAFHPSYSRPRTNCEKPQSDNRVGYQCACSKIGIFFLDELVETLYALMELGAYSTYQDVIVGRHLSQNDRIVKAKAAGVQIPDFSGSPDRRRRSCDILPTAPT